MNIQFWILFFTLWFGFGFSTLNHLEQPHALGPAGSRLLRCVVVITWPFWQIFYLLGKK